jgi:tetratricopeptide (TPR) repeat protein
MSGAPRPGGPRTARCVLVADPAQRVRVPATVRRVAVGILACLVAGCATRQSAEPSGPLATAPAKADEQATAAALRAAKPSEMPGLATNRPDGVETSDATLARALRTLNDAPTSEAYRRVGVEYRRLQVYDQAYEYYTGAIKLDPKNAAAFDGLARTWRDWGVPRLGLSHAYMAVHLAPEWAAAQNTLGTMLYVMGNGMEARRRFERAIALDPTAAYALNNLCYLSFTEGNEARAIAECTDALTRQPTLIAARNNLALVHAAAGRMEVSERELLACGNRAIGFYNLGIVHMARREYPKAIVAFETAIKERPSLWEAQLRANEARTLAAQPLGPGNPMRN